MTPGRLLRVVLAVVAILAVFVGGVVVGGHAQATGLTQLRDPLRSFLLGDSGQELSTQVLDVLKDDYYVKVDGTKLEQASVQAMVDSLHDPYTDYLDPAELQALQQHNDGAYYGVGLQVAQRGKAIVVTHVFPGSPAARAKILTGDRLVSVAGTPTAGRSLDAVVGEIRGPEGSRIALGVATGDAAPRQLDLQRARITVPSVSSRMLTRKGVKIGYVSLTQFTRGASGDLRDAVQALRDKGAKGLVFDLRGDPGGLVSEAVGVAGVFLPDGSTVVVTQGLHSPKHVYRTSSQPVAGDLPMAVLVDRNSASASEIVSGALRDAKRAELVGEHTFGKALVQSTVPLRDGGALKLTTARYLTPAGFDLAHHGLPPDVPVQQNPRKPGDEVLQRGLAVAAGG